METSPFVCGICAKKFQKIANFYLHLSEHDVKFQKEFHICDDSAVRKETDSVMETTDSLDKYVKREVTEDDVVVSSPYTCKVCSCRFSSVCLLHHHIHQCGGSASYIFDGEHNVAYPIKSLCSFFEERGDAPDVTAVFQPENLTDGVNKTTASDVLLENENGELCVEDENSDGCADTACSENRTCEGLLSNKQDSAGETNEEKTNNALVIDHSPEESITSEEAEMKLFGINDTMKDQCTQITSPERKKSARISVRRNRKQSSVTQEEKTRKRMHAPKTKVTTEASDSKSTKKKQEKAIFTCSHCNKVFDYIDRYQVHLISHTTERTHKCEICPRAFKYKRGLKQHMLEHNGELKYCCETCGERFSVTHKLRAHKLAKHVTERPYSCTLCGASFKREYGLIRHSMQHSDKRPFQCEICGMGFTRDTYLEQHKWTHDKTMRRFVCGQCDRRFFTNYQLQCHLKVHTGERPFKCKLCSSGYIQRKELRKHMKKRHGVNMEDVGFLTVIKGENENPEDQFRQVRPVTVLPDVVVQDGVVYENVETQSTIYQNMGTLAQSLYQNNSSVHSVSAD